MPANDAVLENAYSAQDYLDVNVKDDTRVAQTHVDGIAIHQFKDYVGTETNCKLEWEGQSSIAPSSVTVYLQIYNQNTTTWDAVVSNNATAVDTDFILTGDVTDLTNYKDNNLISCRVYQASS